MEGEYTGPEPGTVLSGVTGRVPGAVHGVKLDPTRFPGPEAHRIPVGLPDFKSGVGF